MQEAVGERLHETHQRVFFLVRKPESSDELRVHVIGGLWRRPARGALTGVIGAAAPQDVARVVEVTGGGRLRPANMRAKIASMNEENPARRRG